MNDEILIEILEHSESGSCTYSIGEIDSSDHTQKIFEEVMRRSAAKYIPFLEAKFEKLGADSSHIFYKRPISSDGRVEYGIALYKEDRILGYIPFERDFLGKTWYAGNAGGKIRQFFEGFGAFAEPRFIGAKGRDFYFHKGPLLDLQYKQPSVSSDKACPDKIDHKA